MYIYMNTQPGGNVFRFRGKAGSNDNPRSFQEKMYNNAGHCVVILNEFVNAEDVKIPEDFPVPTAAHIAAFNNKRGN